MDDPAPLIAVLQVLIVVVGTGAGWWLLNRLTAFDDHAALWLANNWAYLLQRVGFVFVQVVGVSSLVGQDVSEWTSLAWVAGALAWATLLAAVGLPLTDWMILRTRTRLATLDSVPLSVALVRLGFYIGLGIVVRATFVGAAPTLRTGLLATLAFTAAGVAALVIAFHLHSVVTRGRLRTAVAAGGVTEGLESAAVLASIGLILYGATAGDFTTWADSLRGFGIALGISYVGVYVARYLIDWFVLTGDCTLKTIHERQQKGAAALLAFLLVMVAIPVSATVNMYVE